MEQHPCNKLGCKTGNITEVCKLMSGEKMGNRVDYSPSHQTQVLTSIHMEPVRVSFKINKYDPSPVGNLCDSVSPKVMKNFTCTDLKTGQVLERQMCLLLRVKQLTSDSEIP